MKGRKRRGGAGHQLTGPAAKFPLVAVSWVDSAMLDGWQRDADFNDAPVQCQTAGFLLRESKKRLLIAHSVNDSGQRCGLLTIPRGAISRMVRL